MDVGVLPGPGRANDQDPLSQPSFSEPMAGIGLADSQPPEAGPSPIYVPRQG